MKKLITYLIPVFPKLSAAERNNQALTAFSHQNLSSQRADYAPVNFDAQTLPAHVISSLATKVYEISGLKQNGPYNVGYDLILGEEKYSLQDYLNQPVRLRYTGKIHCVHCDRVTAKSFNQGYCFPCFRSQAQCDSCIVMPEKCHFHKGTCRDETWALTHCMQDHIIYLANTSGVKVGITRATQLPQRWMDQGAIQALPIFQVNSRYHAGLVEVICKAYVKDKTNWRTMLSGTVPRVDLIAARDQLLKQVDSELAELGIAVLNLDQAEPICLNYPVLQYPSPLGKALNFDNTPIIEGVLLGVKGQYLLLDRGVVNIRKFSGYDVIWEKN